MTKLKLAAALFFTCITILVQAQAPRTVLLEWFTSTGCGPCTWQGPRMDSLHDNNPTSKLITLEYHGNYGNVDPMYFHNTTEPVSRFLYYNFTGYPSGAVDGNYYTGHPHNIKQTTIDNRAAVTSPFVINLTHKINTNGTLDVSATAKAVQTYSASLKMHIVVVEKHIITRKVEKNGESHWTNVMKKMLPNQNGTALPSSWAVNDSTTVNQSWTMQNVYNVDELAVIAFIQNTTTKEILQAKFDDSSLKYNIDFNLSDNVYSKFVGKNATANYVFDVNINSDTADVYEVSLLNTLPAGWSSSFTINGNTYTTPTNVNFAAIDTKSVTVSVTASSAGDERATLTLQVKSATRIGAYKKQFPTYTFCSVTNLYNEKFQDHDTAIANALQQKGLPAVKITDYELDGVDTNGFNKTLLAHYIYDVHGKNIFHGITDNKLKVFRNYLKSGGNILFVSESMGAEVNNISGYYTISTDYTNFYTNYIGANYVSNALMGTTTFVTLNYNTGDSLYKYAGSTQLGGLLSYREVFTPTGGAKSVLKYAGDPTKTGGSIKHNTTDNWKIAYWAFSFGALNKTDGYRSNILKTTIDWFDGVALSIENENEKNSHLTIFPNPATGIITVQPNNNMINNTINIIDAMGKLVTTSDLSTNNNIDISNLSKGLYFVQLINNNEIMGTEKLLIVE